MWDSSAISRCPAKLTRSDTSDLASTDKPLVVEPEAAPALLIVEEAINHTFVDYSFAFMTNCITVQGSVLQTHIRVGAGLSLGGYTPWRVNPPLKIQEQLNRRGTKDTEKDTEEGVSS
jgi:hypothetical protein